MNNLKCAGFAAVGVLFDIILFEKYNGRYPQILMSGKLDGMTLNLPALAK